MCKLSNWSNLYILRNFESAYYLDPIRIEALCFNLGTLGVIGTLLRTKVMLLRGNVCMNASTTVLCFDAIRFFYNECVFINLRNKLTGFGLPLLSTITNRR